MTASFTGKGNEIQDQMKSEDAPEVSLIDTADRVADHLDADVLYYNGPLNRPLCTRVISLIHQRVRRPNVLFILVTPGGSAEVAYRLTRCLQKHYDQFSLYVAGMCKSAGTLVAVGANELVFCDHGELGPLDVQMSKKDELWEMQSGLTVNTALTAIQSKAYLAFEDFFLKIETGSGGAIRVKTAAEIATSLTNGLFGPLYRQIDPLHVGEAARAISIADHYGTRLLNLSQNLSEESLRHLITCYPSHEFVIDREEAEKLFEVVRVPTADEIELADRLGDECRLPYVGAESAVFLSNEIPDANETDDTTDRIEDVEDGNSEEGSREGPDRAAAQPGAKLKKVFGR